MSAGHFATAKVMAVLGEDAALLRVVHAIYDRPTPRASAPFIEINAVSVIDWGTKDRVGAEVRAEVRHIAMQRDAGVVAQRIDASVAALRGSAGAWEIVSTRMIRSRSEYDKQGRWVQTFELRLRCLAAD